MTKQLLLFIQSDNPGLYVNILTHCINFEDVKDVYFAVNSGEVGNLSQAKLKIQKIRREFELLLRDRNEYQSAYDFFPPANQIDSKIIRILFSKPELAIADIKKRFPQISNLIVDISGCNKKVSMDVISAYILNGVNHLCCFELDDRVYSNAWREEGLSKMYHDIRGDIVYYEYLDFSKTGTTIDSFNKMRSQGKVIRLLLMIVIILGVLVFTLIGKQQSILAQYAAFALSLITGVGLINDVFGISNIFKARSGQ